MCASEARCLIRLAQVSLGTTTDGKCWATATQGDIKKAESYLKQVDVSSISRRCQALYYVIESDLFKSKNNTTKAIESSEKVLKIANESQLGALLREIIAIVQYMGCLSDSTYRYSIYAVVYF